MPTSTITLQFKVVPLQYEYIHSRIESGSDDPAYLDHLGHFLDALSRPHPPTTLSGCDHIAFSYHSKAALKMDLVTPYLATP